MNNRVIKKLVKLEGDAQAALIEKVRVEGFIRTGDLLDTSYASLGQAVFGQHIRKATYDKIVNTMTQLGWI